MTLGIFLVSVGVLGILVALAIWQVHDESRRRDEEITRAYERMAAKHQRTMERLDFHGAVLDMVEMKDEDPR